MSQTLYPKVYRSALGAREAFRWSGAPEKLGRFEAAGIITPTDIADVEAVTVLDEVLGIARPLYSLRKMCRVMPMDKLTHKVDVYSKLSAQEKVPPLVEAEIKKHGRTRVSFDLWKNVVHVACSDEAGKKSSHNDLQLEINDAAGALANSENSQIATIAEAATKTSAGSDWGTVTDGRSANNPFTDILTAIESIRGTYGFKPNMVAAHPLVWMDFYGNDFVKGQLDGMKLPAEDVFPIPSMPGIQGLSDWALTSTQALVLDTNNAIVLGDGPTSSEKYRDAKAGYDAYIIRQWLEPKIVNNNAMYELTAVHA